MTEQLEIAVVIEQLIQRISKLEAKAQVDMILIQTLLQNTDLTKTIPILEKTMKGYFPIIKDMPNYENIHKELQERLNVLKNALHNKQKLENS